MFDTEKALRARRDRYDALALVSELGIVALSEGQRIRAAAFREEWQNRADRLDVTMMLNPETGTVRSL